MEYMCLKKTKTKPNKLGNQKGPNFEPNFGDRNTEHFSTSFTKQYRKGVSRPFNPALQLEFFLMSSQGYIASLCTGIPRSTGKNYFKRKATSAHLSTHPTSPHCSSLSTPAHRHTGCILWFAWINSWPSQWLSVFHRQTHCLKEQQATTDPKARKENPWGFCLHFLVPTSV